MRSTFRLLSLSTALASIMVCNVASASSNPSFLERVRNALGYRKHVIAKDRIRQEDQGIKTSEFAGKIRILNVELAVDDKDAEFVRKNSQIKTFIEKIKNPQGVTDKQLQWYVGLINDTPGLKANYYLQNFRKGHSANLVLSIKRQKASILLSAYTKGNDILGKYGFDALTQISNPIGWNDSIILDVATTEKPKRLLVLSAGYLKQLNTMGTSVSAMVSNVNYNSYQGQLKDSRYTKYSANLSQYLSMSKTGSLKANVGVERYDVVSRTEVQGGKDLRYSHNMMYVGAKLKHRDKSNANNTVGVTYHTSLGKVKVKEGLQPYGFDQKFDFIELFARRDQPLGRDFSAVAQFNWFYSSKILPSSLQFVVGTPTAGRGYKSGIISSNRGASGSVELRYTHKANEESALNFVQPYGFVDVTNIARTNKPINKNTLYSAGGGLRLYYRYDIRLEVEVGQPLTRNLVIGGSPVSTKTNVGVRLSKEFRI
jgi:hemolysin activation/secretion protein